MRKIAFIVVCIVLVSCTPTPSKQTLPPPVATYSPNSPPPYIVVKAMYSALNAGDMDRALSFYANDAIYIVRQGPGKGLYIGRNEIRTLLEPDIRNKIISEISDFETSTNLIAMLHRRIQNAEAISSEEETFAVIGGKITGVGVDPASLIRFAFNALNENKTDRALRLFVDDPACLLISDSPLTEKQALRDAFQKYVDAGDVFEVSDIDAVEYYKVTWTLKIYDPQGKVIAETRRLSDIDSGLIQNCRLPEKEKNGG